MATKAPSFLVFMLVDEF